MTKGKLLENLPSQTARDVLKQLDEAWSSFYKLKKPGGMEVMSEILCILQKQAEVMIGPTDQNMDIRDCPCCFESGNWFSHL